MRSFMRREFWHRSIHISPKWYTLAVVILCITSAFLYKSTQLQAHMIRNAQGSARSAADEVVYLSNVHITKLITLGHNHAAADLLWIRSIQYFVSHFLTDRRYPWLEHFVNQIIELDPSFKQVYLWAASCILYGQSITPERVHKSNRLYKKALEHFPNDYEAAYRLGMNYYAELQVDDPQLRAQYKALGLAYFERAAHAPNAPQSVRGLIRGIAKLMGRQEVLFYTLSEEYVQSKDVQHKKQIKKRLDGLIEKMKGSGTLDKILHTMQQHEKRRIDLFPYLKLLDFTLIDMQAPQAKSWQELL